MTTDERQPSRSELAEAWVTANVQPNQLWIWYGKNGFTATLHVNKVTTKWINLRRRHVVEVRCDNLTAGNCDVSTFVNQIESLRQWLGIDQYDAYHWPVLVTVFWDYCEHARLRPAPAWCYEEEAAPQLPPGQTGAGRA